MKSLGRLFIVVVALTLVLLGLAFVLPQEVKFQRETIVDAPPERVYPYLVSMRQFAVWSPWQELDTSAKPAFSGPEAGPGARITWTNTQRGGGFQEVKESADLRSVLYRLEWGGADTIFAGITLDPLPDNKTKVVWTYRTDLGMNPFKRYVGQFYSSWAGADYELGLKRLKDAAEKGTGVAVLDPSTLPPAIEKALTDKEPQPAPLPNPEVANRDPDVVTIEARPIVYVSTQASSGDQQAIEKALGEANLAVIEFITKHSLEVSGAPLAISHAHEPGANRRFDAAIPLTALPPGLPEEGIVKLGATPAGKAIMMVHKGSYRTIDETYAKLRQRIKDKGLKEGKYFWEEYVTDSGEADEAELLTNIYIMVE